MKIYIPCCTDMGEALEPLLICHSREFAKDFLHRHQKGELACEWDHEIREVELK